MKNEVVVCGVPFKNPNIKEILKTIKRDGVTAVQIYMHWNRIETEKRGEFDFSYYDGDVALLKEAGLKFVPFILIGPKYAAPKWWLESDNFVPLRCLEHNKECPIDSIWNPAFRTEIDRVVKAFADHYLPMDVLESVQPGICGDYGEAIMPVHGNWAGAYHTHKGMWCGGEDAKASFRDTMQKQYGNIEALNKAWRSYYKDFSEIETFLSHKAPSRTAWFDLVEWYRGSMTEFVDFWMKTTRKYFPDTPIYMCTGGVETPEHASLFSEQAKVCAKYGGGLRLTNERNDFFSNFFDCNAYMHNACELYGADLGLEPVGSMTKEGIGSRILGSAFYGNQQIFFYYGNIYPDNEMDGERAQIFRKNIHLIHKRKTENKVAVLWPKYVGVMEGGIPERIRPTAKFIRQRTNYNFVNENMIADGALDNISLLILPCDLYTDTATLDTICDWVEKGGILFTCGAITNLELEPVERFNLMLGFTKDSDIREGHTSYIINKDIPFKRFAKNDEFPSSDGFNNLAEDVIELATSKEYVLEEYIGMECEKLCSAFYRKVGKGTAITYMGPREFDYNPQDIFARSYFPDLLDDVLANYAKDLRIADGEVVRGEIDGEIYALKPDGEIIKV